MSKVRLWADSGAYQRIVRLCFDFVGCSCDALRPNTDWFSAVDAIGYCGCLQSMNACGCDDFIPLENPLFSVRS